MQIKCPICHQLMTENNNRLTCVNNHSFDKAKQGYYHLDTTNKKHKGDDSLMVTGRIRFLSSGAYDHLVCALQQIMHHFNIHSLLDYACGPGFYASKLDVNDKVGIDLSKEAIKYAAKNDKSTHYYIANGFSLPFFDHSFDGIMVVFAPNSLDEFARLLKKDGHLIIVSPGPNHLVEMKHVLYDTVYTNPYKPIEDSRFLLQHSATISQKVTMNQTMIADCFDMTPYRYKTKPSAILKLHQIEKLDITCEFMISIYTLR